MDIYINKLAKLLPDVIFKADKSFYWSPKQQQVHYIDQFNEANIWALLHEASHALLNHTSYDSDFELLQLEVAAWEEAKNLSEEFDLTVDEDHIQDCLDTYRDWLHQRSTCPSCSSVSLQRSSNEYRCHNCYTVWQVSNSRFCRPYRLRRPSNIKVATENRSSPVFD